jgi:hypothetical protein
MPITTEYHAKTGTNFHAICLKEKTFSYPQNLFSAAAAAAALFALIRASQR